MAGMGPPPKPQAARTRHKAHVTHAVLYQREDGEIEIPPMPRSNNGKPWNVLTKRWWKDIWSSPMAVEYDESDIHGIYQLAALVNDFWEARSARERREASAEIRLAGQRFGISPLDRRRLQWEISRGEQAEAERRKRQARDKAAEQAQAQPPTQTGDPRSILRQVV